MALIDMPYFKMQYMSMKIRLSLFIFTCIPLVYGCFLNKFAKVLLRLLDTRSTTPEVSSVAKPATAAIALVEISILP